MTFSGDSPSATGSELIWNLLEQQQPSRREMPVVLAVVIALVVGVIGFTAGAFLRRRRTPSELRGDWWAAFERDFHLYVAKLSDSPSARWRRRR